jgi:hypothetical protein
MNEARSQSGETLFDGVDEFRGEFPNLADLLTGCEASGSTAALPPFNVTLFVRDGRLRFSVSSKGFDLWAVGELERAADGFVAIEEALATGRVAWKVEADQKGGSKK